MQPGIIEVLIIIITFKKIIKFKQGLTAQNELTIKSSCTCSGYNKVFDCSIVGEGTTVWQGSVFDCSTNDISLRHTNIASGVAIGVCNDGAIVGRGIAVNGSCYTSQLTVNVNSAMDGRTVECVYDDGASTNTIGTTVLTLTSACKLYVYIAVTQ